MFREFPGTIESCKVGCIFSSSPLQSTSAWYLTILYKVWSWTSMWLGRRESWTRQTYVYMAWHWNAWLFPHHPPFHLRLSDCDCWWSSHSSPLTTGGSATTHPSTLTFNLFHFDKIRREDSNIEYSAFRLYNFYSLYRVLAFIPGIFLESGWVWS